MSKQSKKYLDKTFNIKIPTSPYNQKIINLVHEAGLTLTLDINSDNKDEYIFTSATLEKYIDTLKDCSTKSTTKNAMDNVALLENFKYLIADLSKKLKANK